MNIILVRHAKSYYDWSKYPTDDVRPLSEKGIARQKQAAISMKHFNLKFDSVWVSPYRRAQETLDLILKTYKITVPISVVNKLIPGGDEDELFSLLQKQQKLTPSAQLLLVGHNPVISSLLEILSSSEFYSDMRTSEVAVCDLSDNGSQLIKYFDRKILLKGLNE